MKSWLPIVLSLLTLAGMPVTGQSQCHYPFADFPAEDLYKGKPALPKLTTPTQREFRTVLRIGSEKRPNFAGHYTVVEWGCGSNCIVFAVIDAVSGKVYDSAMPAINDEYPCGLLYRSKSKLFVVEKSRNPNGDCKAEFYTWDGSRFIAVHDSAQQLR